MAFTTPIAILSALLLQTKMFIDQDPGTTQLAGNFTHLHYKLIFFPTL